jgi:DNA-binding transcriptional LysR family regulator
MEMYQVRYFLAVAEHLNFTRAAERLHVAQPSLTRAIQKLEDELAGPLFRRERANTHLTELGRMMLPHLRASLAAAEAAKRQAASFRKRESGQLSVGACSTVSAEFGAPLLAAVAEEVAELEFHVEIDSSEGLERRLLAGDLDAAFLTPLDGAAIAHDRLDLRPVVEDALVVAFPPGHRFENTAEVTLEDLDGEALVIRPGCGREDAVAAAMEARGIARVVRHRSGDERWLGEMVRAGLGSVLWPEAVARARRLSFRRLSDLPITFRVALATVAGRRHSPALAALIRQAATTYARSRPDSAA